MIRHYFVAALRNMATNRLLSGISILGLSVGIAATILMAMVIRNQLTFDDFMPGHERTYEVISPPHPLEPVKTWSDRSDPDAANFLRLNVSEVESAARLVVPSTSFVPPMKLQQGSIVGWDELYWADPNIFNVLQLPVLYGDLSTALVRPDGIVLPRAMAEKYFGRDDVIGRTLTVDGHPMIVRAVIRDLPANGTGLKSGIFASGRAAFSGFSRDTYPATNTYLRLRPGANVASVEKEATAHFMSIQDKTAYPVVKLLRLDQVNLFEILNPGIRARLLVAGLTGLLILFIASVNFINLTMARSARREREVGVRKVCGADRKALMIQFLGEALIAVVLAAAIALAASEWLLPPLNAFLQTGARLGYGDDPQMLLLLALAVLALALAAGAYPAFVLSSYKPTGVLQGWVRAGGHAGIVRNLLVTTQFAILIVLVISAGVVWQQRQFAVGDASQVATDQILIVKTMTGSICPTALRDALRQLPGVRSESCTGSNFLQGSGAFAVADDGDPAWKKVAGFSITTAFVQPGLFALYGIKPVAGSLTSSPIGDATDNFGAIINVAAVRKLGFASAQAAIGHSWVPAGVPLRPSTRNMFGPHAIITAVIPNFAFYSVAGAVKPTVYSPWLLHPPGGLIHVRLDDRQIPETLAAIDRLWITTGQQGPLDRFFLNDYMQQQYLDMTREAELFAIFAGVAIFLACLGLMGVAVSTAERRTKEIGIRRAMGATGAEVVALLLWQFSQPVLWANVIAWPAAWWLMRRWLSGFVYHVEMHAWLFIATSIAALAIALLAVSGQALLMALQKPILALRYE